MATRDIPVATRQAVHRITDWAQVALPTRRKGKHIVPRRSNSTLDVRTNKQHRGVLPPEPGRDDIRSSRRDDDEYGSGGGRGYDDDETSGGKKKDSTMGKIMEKAGGLLKSEKIERQGAEKRQDAGAYGSSGTDNY